MTSRFCRLLVALIFFTGITLSAAPPGWWAVEGTNCHAIIDSAITDKNPKGPANIGQAKFMVKRSLEELKVLDPGMAGEIRNLLVLPQPKPANRSETLPPILDLEVPDPKPSNWSQQQHAPLLIGQLKAVAQPFYDCLYRDAPLWVDCSSAVVSERGQLQLNGARDPADVANHYSWTFATADDNNHAIATIGQLKSIRVNLQSWIPVPVARPGSQGKCAVRKSR
ncbi:MAG: hypothetical protein ABIS50_07020 [Luteolibacter sp.]|uniref:hypothetical protein n=1 Tax=Luteolibacter sp. TaxID=1962973 RepID=UPI003262D54B